MRTVVHVLLVAVASLVLSGCTSNQLAIPTDPVRANEEVVGEVMGSSTGIMLFQFIPINQNNRFVKAYEDALSKSGATRIVNPKIQERWFWGYILNGYTFKVTGTGVRAKGGARP